MASEIAEPVAATETSPLLCSKSIEEHSKHRSSLTASPDGLQHGAIPEVSLTNEASILVRYSGPLVVTYFLQYVYQLVIIGVAAQLSTEEIAGVSLGITTSNITGYALFEGFATALDTLCSQAYGSRRLTDVGLYTIRGTILVHLAAVLPVGTLWLCSSYIFERLVPQPELVEHASSFLYWTLIGVPVGLARIVSQGSNVTDCTGLLRLRERQTLHASARQFQCWTGCARRLLAH